MSVLLLLIAMVNAACAGWMFALDAPGVGFFNAAIAAYAIHVWYEP